ncbi:hypothetical protein BDD12DRAFT_809987 [Trichophaea hybrida]|nr:hypothetical protein BDD12DRAFT_809987 [Trichophaea hybrida]
MPSGCPNDSSQMLIHSRGRLNKSASGLKTPVLASANGQQKPWAFGRLMGGLTLQWKNNKVRMCVWEIAQSMNVSNKLGAGPKKWDLSIEHCVVATSDLAPKRPLQKWYKADITILNGQKLKTAGDECTDVGLRQWMQRIPETPTKNRIFVHIGIYFIAPILHLLSLMMCRYRRQCRINTGSQVITDQDAAMKFNNPTLFCIVHHGQQADITSGTQTPMRSSRSYLSGVGILQHPAEDMIDDIGEELDHDADTRYPNPSNFPTTTGFQKF